METNELTAPQDAPVKENGFEMRGEFGRILRRNNPQIRNDRAIEAYKSAQRFYKREIEDMQVKLDEMDMERNRLFDISPTSKDSLRTQQFDGKEVAVNDIKLTTDMRNLRIKIEECIDRFNTLFGERLPS